MRNKTYKKNTGAAMMILIFFFVFISLTILIGIVTPVVREFRITSDNLESKQAYFTTESGIEDVMYRMRNSKQIGSSETLVLGSSSATTTITTLSGNSKQISTQGDMDSHQRKVDLVLSTSEGVSFNYGVQVGQGGFNLTGNAKVIGNVYSNGSITGESNTSITGTAISANGPALASDQSNGTGTPAYDISFANASGTQDFAQSFQVSNTEVVNKVQLYIKKVASPSNLTVRIAANSGSSPATSSLTTGSLSASLVSTNYGWIDIPFSTNPILTSGTTYWIVVDGVTSSTNYYKIGANNNGYANGTGKIGAYGGTFNNTTPVGLDGYFNLYLGGVTGLISGMDIGTGSTGDAKAHTVNDSTVLGSLYCQSGTENNKSCNTSLPDPTQTSMPISDQNILDWKEDASVGGIYSGNYSLSNNSTASLGPKEITGNLTVDGNAVLTITGTLWVHGNITIGSNAVAKLASSYGTTSGVIVADGNVNLSGNNGLQGSGQSGSYILLVTTSTCPVGPSCGGGSTNAITIGSNADAVILNAEQGTISFSGNAQVNEATAKTIIAGGNTIITYLSGLADVNFSSGPSGSWSVSSWKEVQ